MREETAHDAASHHVAFICRPAACQQIRDAAEGEHRRDAMEHAAMDRELANHGADAEPDEQIQPDCNDDNRVAT